jgi:hypothetical protein
LAIAFRTAADDCMFEVLMFCFVNDAGRFCWPATAAFLPAFDFIDWFARPLNWYVRAADVLLPPL